MKIEKGTSRIAIVGEKITIKLPAIDFKRMIRAIREAIKGGWLMDYMTDSENHIHSFARHALRGFKENIREYRLSQEISDKTIVPTRISIFGILNIQDTAIDVDLPHPAIGTVLIDKIPNQIMIDHGAHTILDSSNFGLHEGLLKIRDYGELGLDFLLKNYEKEIEQALVETMAKQQ